MKCPLCGVQPFADLGPCACAREFDELLVARVRAALARGVDGDERADVERWLEARYAEPWPPDRLPAASAPVAATRPSGGSGRPATRATRSVTATASNRSSSG